MDSESAPAPPHKRSRDAQWEQPDERRSPAEVVTVLTVERTRIPGGSLSAWIHLLAAGPTIARALPEHGLALATEAKTVAEHAAAQHREPAYALTVERAER
jgi:hypothetical protein